MTEGRGLTHVCPKCGNPNAFDQHDQHCPGEQGRVSSPRLLRGHVTWLGRAATVWHALPHRKPDGKALCGRVCIGPQGAEATFDPTHPHACLECCAALVEVADV